MTEAGKSEKILNIFTTDSHHKNISVIFVTQNIFSQKKKRSYYFTQLSVHNIDE
jgi:hypothetical protein